MVFDPHKAKMSFQKLRKSLKALSKRPSAKRVHVLRTRIRRVEAVIHALMLDRSHEGKRLLRTLAPIRKKAGRVRDIDVLIGFAVTLGSGRPVIIGEEECLIQLVEHLSATRLKSVRRLRNTFSAQRKEARLHIKQCATSLEKQLFASRKHDAENQESSADTIATTLNLWRELSDWPRLNASNLHPFRIEVKELRYILELMKDEDKELASTLAEVKDKIGEWHDWNQLTTIATEILGHGGECSLLQQIRSITKEKFEQALDSTNAMRKKYRSVGKNWNIVLDAQ